jgi:t-SNARE complex subunit (syntaxin)
MDLAIEIETNEQLIAQREKGIEEIEQTIVEINELFRDLATMVHEQGFMLGMCYNVGRIAQRSRAQHIQGQAGSSTSRVFLAHRQHRVQHCVGGVARRARRARGLPRPGLPGTVTD